MRFGAWKQSSFRDSEFHLGMVYEGAFVCRAQIRLKAATNACHVISGTSCDAYDSFDCSVNVPKAEVTRWTDADADPPTRVGRDSATSPRKQYKGEKCLRSFSTFCQATLVALLNTNRAPFPSPCDTSIPNQGIFFLHWLIRKPA
jgi:hypothetical protein